MEEYNSVCSIFSFYTIYTTVTKPANRYGVKWRTTRYETTSNSWHLVQLLKKVVDLAFFKSTAMADCD